MHGGGVYTGLLYSFGENFLSKSICSFFTEEEKSTFLAVGQSQQCPNELHVQEHSGDNNFVLCQKIYQTKDLLKKVISGGKEENSRNLLLSQNIISPDNYLTVQTPEETQVKSWNHKNEGIAINADALSQKCVLNTEKRIEIPNSEDIAINPNDLNKCVAVGDSRASLIDLETGKIERDLFTEDDRKKFTQKLQLNHCVGDPFDQRYCLASGKNLILKDLRTKESCLTIEGCHTMEISSIDMNPNRSNRLQTSSQDFFLKIWDLRKPEFSILTYEEKSNGIDDVKFNRFYDQLVLYSTSDGFLGLYEAISVSSAPVLDLDGEDNSNKDGFIKGYEGCLDDSIYSICWSAGDPWVFAGVNYKADIYFDLVPEAHKQKVLL